ncbi:MAG: integration host factor subunit alpha [Methylothermaceae bacteria B42]|nr:MAG: integration host factor subunit alpha [Methylothermaceae bacteria B42]HHJ38312.1 integration host factor subunit alpha [Methylothermaceae bacterium]
MTVTKADIVEKLYEEIGLNRKDAKELVDFFFEEIKNALERGEAVKISGFGNFDLRDKNERPGRNPKTGEEIPVSARRVVTFKAGQKLKSKIDSFTQEES